jgi:hypothetical protein
LTRSIGEAFFAQRQQKHYAAFLHTNILPLVFALLFSPTSIRERSMQWGAMFLSLGVVCTAIGLGLWGSAWSRRKRKGFRFQYICNKLGNISGICLVIFSFVISSLDPQGAIWNRDFLFYMAVASPCILGVGEAVRGAKRLPA